VGGKQRAGKGEEREEAGRWLSDPGGPVAVKKMTGWLFFSAKSPELRIWVDARLK